MKVLLVSQPASDGVFRHVEGLADYLMRQGATVHLAYSDRAACDQLPKLVERVAVGGGQTLNLRVGNSPEPADAPALLALHRIMRATQPEIIHAHSSKAGALVRGLALLGMKRRIFYTPHAYYRMHAPQGAKARAFHAIERALAGCGTTITCSNDETAFANTVIGVRPRRHVLVHNGVDCDRFRPPTPEEKRGLRTQFNIPQDALVIGTVGRFSAQKDPLTTYGAFIKAAATLPSLFFAHLGKGELEPEVDSLLANSGLASRCRRIRYLADTAPFYRVLDGFVLASLYEGMSYAVLEALATGLPLILSCAPGNQDFAGHGLDRIDWVPPENVPALVEAITVWYRRSRSSDDTSNNHREIALRQFSLETSYARIVSAYREAQAATERAAVLV
jgi:glycosyltransferase involved in cell wall biosynthesis